MSKFKYTGGTYRQPTREELISERVKLARERIEKINDLIDDIETQEDITLVQNAYDGFIYTAWRIEHDGGVIPQDILDTVNRFNQLFVALQQETQGVVYLNARNIGDIIERPTFFDNTQEASYQNGGGGYANSSMTASAGYQRLDDSDAAYKVQVAGEAEGCCCTIM